MLDPGNLSQRARRDLSVIVEQSNASYGPNQADHLEGEIIRRCRAIAEGHGLGHPRLDVSRRRSFRFWPIPPFVIVYDARSRLVVRILHGRRDIPAVLR